MPVTDISDFINRATGGNSGAPESIFGFKVARVGAAAAAATIAGRLTSLWQYAGQNPTGGSAPGGTARIPTRATAGALGQANPTGGRKKWIPLVLPCALNAGSLIVYDRLADISTLNATTTTAQNITGLAVDRFTGTASVGNQIWLEVYTLIGVTATTITASYTNQAGTAGRTTEATVFGGTGYREAQRLIILPLQQGDTGVRSVENVDLLATTGTAGDFGVTIARQLVVVPCPLPGVAVLRDLVTQQPYLAEAATNAAITFAWLANTAVAPELYTQVFMLEA